jgi:hypothetical protein
MTDITIPPAALEAAKRAYVNCEDDDNCIEAACLAMLQSWPGINTAYTFGGVAPPRIILPLSQEPKDD